MTSITSLTLVNADTGADIAALQHGAVLNLATLPTRNLNVRATVVPVSVSFNLDGVVTNETVAPYAMKGDVNGVYNKWTPTVGNHTLVVTPSGGPPLTVGFTVQDTVIVPPLPPSGLLKGISTFATIGSIGAGSNLLTVADASGLAVNDSVIVEPAGARETIGPGGTWPDLGYASAAAMAADTGQPAWQYAYRADTRNVYRNNNGTWQQAIGGDSYYLQKVMPRALVAKITAKSGNTLTLDKSAKVAAANAQVYFDNFPIVNALGNDNSTVPDGSEVAFPAGRYALSSAFLIHAHDGWNVYGAGADATTLFFPKGIGNRGVIFLLGSHRVRVHNLGIEGNFRTHGYMNAWVGGNQTQAYYNYGLYVQQSHDVVIEDVKATDCTQAVTFAFCNNATARRCKSILTEGVFVESWQFQAADGTNAQLSDLSVTSPVWLGGFELFRCTDSGMARCNGINTFFALNTVNNFTLTDITLVINGAARHVNSYPIIHNPIIDINANIGAIPVTSGGRMANINVTQNGTVPPTNDTLKAISINVSNVKISLDGAVIKLPGYTAPSTLQGAVGYVSDAASSSVHNVTCRGTTKWANVVFRGANSTYSGLQVDSVSGGRPVAVKFEPADEGVTL